MQLHSFLEKHNFPSLLSLSEGVLPGRVFSVERELTFVDTPRGLLYVELSGKYRNTITDPADYPIVGDRILLRYGGEDGVHLVEEILPRETFIYRRNPGSRNQLQPIAANVDLVFIVQGLDRDFNIRRLERYVSLINESGAKAVIVLNKRDLVASPEDFMNTVRGAISSIPILCVSALTGEGVEDLYPFFTGRTLAALLGSSGAGKSSLINRFPGVEEQKTGDLRVGDGKGRHTTTTRTIFEIPGKGFVMDTPGMRELGLLDAQEGVRDAFPEIEALAKECRFRDCTHQNEPGCAVLREVEEGGLSSIRLESYRKLLREAEYEESKEDGSITRKRKEKWKQIHKEYKKTKKAMDRRTDELF